MTFLISCAWIIFDFHSQADSAVLSAEVQENDMPMTDIFPTDAVRKERVLHLSISLITYIFGFETGHVLKIKPEKK